MKEKRGLSEVKEKRGFKRSDERGERSDVMKEERAVEDSVKRRASHVNGLTVGPSFALYLQDCH